MLPIRLNRCFNWAWGYWL